MLKLLNVLSGLKGRRLRSSRGFTLIELVIVIALISILAGISLYNHRNATTRAKEGVLKEDLFRMRDAIDQYYADKGKYPSNLEALVADQYLRGVPKDPFTDSTTTWQEIPAEPDPNNPSADLGMFNVKSGSDQTALDGSKYSDW
jgi:general secretion pathway protein G